MDPTPSGRIGRQAPVKRCLARFAGLASCVSNGRARTIAPLRRKMDGVPFHGTHMKIVTALAVGKHLLDAGDVRLVHQRQLLQLAHAAWRFRTHQVALTRVHAFNFAMRGMVSIWPWSPISMSKRFILARPTS